MTKVGLGFGDKTGQIAAKLCRFLINKLALCFNEVDNGFADPFEDTEWSECIELGVNSNCGKTVPILKKH